METEVKNFTMRYKKSTKYKKCYRDNSDNIGKNHEIIHLEDVRWFQKDEYNNTIFIVNLDVMEKLKINDLVLKDLARALSKRNNIFCDIAQKSFLEIRC